MPFFKKKQKDELVFTPAKEEKKEEDRAEEDKRTIADAVENGPLYQALFDSYSQLPTPKPQKGLEEEVPVLRREETDDETDEEEDEAMRKKLERQEEEELNPEQDKTPKLKQLNSKDTESFKTFKVFRRQVRNLKDGTLMNIETELEIRDMGLQQNLAAYGIQFDCEEEKLLFGRTQQHYFVPLERIFAHWESFQSAYLSNEMKKLKEWLEPEYERFKRKVDLLVSKGKITFDTLWYLFSPEGKVFARVRGDMIAGAKIVSRNYSGSVFNVAAKSIKSNGAVYFDAPQTYNITGFRGTMDITDLKCQPMTDEMLQLLTARGKIFRRITQGHHYRDYKGFLMVQQQWGSNLFKADGRVMIDLKTFERLIPGYQEFKNPSGISTIAQLNSAYQGASCGAYAKLKLDQLYLAWPTVAGFSFSCKKWGEIRVDNVTRINFDDQAYERLVMPANKKELVQALVDQHHKLKKKKRPGFADLISGKGGGCIFLLHGPPGVGKTLTAEAIAEYLHLPLYSVSVGELGTNTKDLELKLQEILELASIWNAVILMDEADIFLERRSDNDVVRNAMVGIFLRLLEYYQGVLFLTTNRVRCFDEAFHSRISVALKYEELSAEARELVWNNFFDAAGVELVDPKDLAQHPLNGRQIRNVIQLSRALSQREGTQVDTGHIVRTMQIATQFQEAIKTSSVDEAMKAKIRRNNMGANEAPVPVSEPKEPRAQ